MDFKKSAQANKGLTEKKQELLSRLERPIELYRHIQATGNAAPTSSQSYCLTAETFVVQGEQSR